MSTRSGAAAGVQRAVAGAREPRRSGPGPGAGEPRWSGPGPGAGELLPEEGAGGQGPAEQGERLDQRWPHPVMWRRARPHADNDDFC